MKDYFKLKKSKLLLLALLTMIGGVSSAWADAYTTGFESTDGWATISDMGGTETKWNSQGYYASDYELSTTYKYQGTKGLYNGQANNDTYFITPKIAAGKITFWAAGKKESGGANNYVKVFKCTDNGDGTFTIDTSNNLSTHSYYNYTGNDYLKCNKYNITYTEYSFDLDADSHLAFYLSKAGIDNFTAENGIASTVVPDKSVGITAFTTTTPSVSANSENKYNASFSVTVKNYGSQDIVEADNVTVSLLNASDEVIATSDAIEISQVEGSKVITLNYEGTATTDQTVIFKAKDNFSDKTFATTAEVAVTAYGARFGVDKTKTNFGLLELNATCTPQTFEITNSGNSDLIITVGETGDAYAYKTLLFSNNKNWSNVYLYAWNSDGNLTDAFPGNEQTTTVGTNPEGETLYAITVPKGATKIIVSNGNSGNGNQSADIEMDFTKTGLFLNNSFAGVFYGDGDLLVRANSKNILAVGLTTTTAGVKSGSIELTYTALNASSSTISVSGVVMPADADVVDFNTAIPSTWENQDNGWSIYNNEAAKCTGKKNLTTQKLDFSGEENPFFLMMVKASDSGSGDFITVEGSTDNGTTWTAFDKKTYSYPTDFGASNADYSAIIVSIPNTVNKLRFNGYYVLIDQIVGLKYSDNDPRMGIYANAECTVAATTAENKEFGFVTDAPAAITYYIKNDGTGTMNLTLADNVTGMTAALGATALTAGQSTTLTITKDATKGFFGGDAVVTAEGLGTFNVSVSGVLVDENKFDLDFTTKDIPAAWTNTNNNWSKNPNGYIESSYIASTLETTTLTATAGEKLVVMAKNSYTGSSYYFGVKYKKVGDENWSDLITEESQGTSWKMLVGTIAEAGDYLLQFNGKYAQIQRIYGLSKPDAPEMVVYDGENVASASYNFGKVTDENDATWTLTVKNEGEAVLTGLAVALSGDNAEHYTAVVEGSKTELAKNETVTITVTQLKNNLGTHSATLTISATGLDSKEITLSGQTVDHTVLDVDFADNSWPAGWQHGSWSVSYGEATSAYDYSSIVTTPLTVAEGDKLTFDVKRSSSSATGRDLIVRYTTDGGITWTTYDWSNYNWSATETLKEQITSSYNTFEITGIPAGTVAFEFSGKYIKLDNITGDYKNTTGPLVTFTTVEDNISGANLKADATATYTLVNNGNADYVATIITTNVSAEVSGDDVTFEAGTLTVPAGKTASITVTMAFAAPYGEKTGNLSITSTSWVGDITDNYTATLVDPTNFVEDFAANARPAGWYKDNSWYFASGSAYINAGTAKPLITEKIEAEASTNRNVLSFDAKKYYDYDTNAATLSVYTSADRKDWTLRKECTLDNDDNFVTFTLDALADGEYYVKFEGTNARLDNIMGVKKILPAPEHDLFLVSATLPTDEITPNTNYGATLNVASLRASEVVAAELYFGDTKVTELTGQTINSGATLTFQLTGKTPAAGTYDVYAKVYNADASVETDHVSVTVADTRKLYISAFPNATAVQADDNNEFTATFNVTVENTGTASLDASDVSVTLIDNADANNVFTATWSPATSNVLYMNTEKDGTDIATGCTLKAWCWNTAEDGVWATFTNINPGFWSIDLNGKTNFKICRYNDAGTDADPWNNVWNASGDLSLTNGNLVKFTGYNDNDMNFSSDNMAYLEPTMTTTLKVTVTGTLTDGENASFAFKAKENVSDTYYGSGLTSNVSVTAAPTIVLDETDGTVASTGQNRNVTLNRTFVAGWNTICLPFAIEATDIHAEAKALAFTAYDTNTKELTFSPVTELEANKPYVIWVENAITEPIEFTGKTVTTSDDPETAFNGVTFQGTYTSMAAGSLSGMWGLTASGKIAKAGASTTMKGFRAYFDGIPATGATARFLDDESTGISSITIDGSAEGVYNLQGQKVEQLHKGGLYIINGKKVVIK